MGRNDEVIAICSRKSAFIGKGESIGNAVHRKTLCTAFCAFWGKGTSGIA